jgi:Skp family chaperone for outer membrane proteins
VEPVWNCFLDFEINSQAQNTCQQLRAAREADAATWQKQHANDMTTLQAHHQREIAMMKEQLQRTQRSESEFAERRQQTSQQLQNRVDELTSAAESLTERLVAVSFLHLFLFFPLNSVIFDN